jgi:hypothetical protein
MRESGVSSKKTRVRVEKMIAAQRFDHSGNLMDDRSKGFDQSKPLEREPLDSFYNSQLIPINCTVDLIQRPLYLINNPDNTKTTLCAFRITALELLT